MNKLDYFPLPLLTERLEGGYEKLVAPFKFVHKDICVFIQKGFVFDGASIPKFLWSIYGGPFSDKNKTAALVHDFLCDNKSHIFYRNRHDIFKTILKIKGKSWFVRGSMFNAVVVWGFFK